MDQFKIGDVKITRIIESEAPWPGTWLIPNATAENVKKEADWLYPTFSDEGGKLRMSIHALIIESIFCNVAICAGIMLSSAASSATVSST